MVAGSQGTNTELISRVEGPVGTIIMNRPAKLNALSRPFLQSFRELIRSHAQNDSVRAIVLTGHGRAFCAGADIGDMSSIDPTGYDAFVSEIQQLVLDVSSCPKPIIAALNGDAYGAGFELALACDLRIAVSGARFAFPEVRVGLIPAAGGTHFLAMQVPSAIASEMLLLGTPVTSEKALKLGLINDVVADEELIGTASRVAADVVEAAPLAQRAVKELLRSAPTTDLVEALRAEKETSISLFGTVDAKTGLRAFLDKTRATFNGR